MQQRLEVMRRCGHSRALLDLRARVRGRGSDPCPSRWSAHAAPGRGPVRPSAQRRPRGHVRARRSRQPTMPFPPRTRSRRRPGWRWKSATVWHQDRSWSRGREDVIGDRGDVRVRARRDRRGCGARAPRVVERKLGRACPAVVGDTDHEATRRRVERRVEGLSRPDPAGVLPRRRQPVGQQGGDGHRGVLDVPQPTTVISSPAARACAACWIVRAASSGDPSGSVAWVFFRRCRPAVCLEADHLLHDPRRTRPQLGVVARMPVERQRPLRCAGSARISSPTRSSPSQSTSTRMPPRWTRPRSTPRVVSRSRCAHGSASRAP